MPGVMTDDPFPLVDEAMAELPAYQNLVSTLQQCRQKKNPYLAKQLLHHMRRHKLDAHGVLGNHLVPTLVGCGCLPDAQGVFDGLTHRTEHSWSSLISGYIENRQFHHAFQVYHDMHAGHVHPSNFTFVALLRACALLRDEERGSGIHTEVIKHGLENISVVGNILIDMYGKCGLLTEAQKVFDELPSLTSVSWNALIAGYAEHGFGDEALRCFDQMRLQGAMTNDVTFSTSLKACASIGSLEMGQEIHAEIVRRGLEMSLFVGNTLINMYIKCSALMEGHNVFEKLCVRDIVSWNSIIKGYGENHYDRMAMQCFDDMQKQGVKPNDITFTCLLAVCSHANLIDKGKEYFKLMTQEYKIEPMLDHCISMVNLLVRSGNFQLAERFADGMHCLQSKEILRTLLCACKTYGEIELGLKYFQLLVKINEETASAYLLLADIYASVGNFSDANRIVELRIHAKAKEKVKNA